MNPFRLIFAILSFFFALTTNAQKWGDVNLDKTVDISDIIAVINVIAGDSQYSSTADVNKDNTIDISDIVAIINIIAGLGYDQSSYESLADNVQALLANNSDMDYDALTAYLKDNPYVVSMQMDGGMMYVSTSDGMELQVDLDGVSAMGGEAGAYINPASLATSIDSTLGYDLDNSYASAASRKESATVSKGADRRNAAAATIPGQPSVLLWAPWGERMGDHNYLVKSVSEIAAHQKLAFKCISGSACTLESMKEFSKYTLVIIDCHGSTRGDIVVPETAGWKKVFGKIKGGVGYCHVNNYRTASVNGKTVVEKFTERGIFFNPLLLNCVPALENKTIIWTIMCHAFRENSHVRQAFAKQGALAFMGASTTVNSECPLGFFRDFASRFFNQCREGGATIEDAFSGNTVSLPYDIMLPYKYERNVYVRKLDRMVKEQVQGNYCCTVNGHFGYRIKWPRSLCPSDGRPRASRIVVSGSSPFRSKPLQKVNGAAAIVGDGSEAGFYFKNISTGESQHVPFSENSVENYNLYSYQNIITRCVMTGKIDNLDYGKYTYQTYLRTDDGIIYSDDVYEFEKSLTLCPDDNHPHAIDLGIGVKFACCNVGASAPWEYGGYYAWGETEEKERYAPDSYKYCKYSIDDFEYQYQSLGRDISGTQYDVAHVKWGGGWHMPSNSQFVQLQVSCSNEWISLNGVEGTKITGSNGGTIFLPAAGCRWYDGTNYAGSDVFYWSSTQTIFSSSHSFHLNFRMYQDNYRFYGECVRPVKE